jgi:hypothetical protein
MSTSAGHRGSSPARRFPLTPAPAHGRLATVELPHPDPDLPYLADVVPSVLAAMGVSGFDARIGLPVDIAGACVLLIDGLGAEQLDAHAGEAPVLAGMRGATVQVGFPSTTAAGITAIGTGCLSGQHGVVGYCFRVPSAGVINALRWRPHPWGPDLRGDLPPETVQPLPTTFERAARAGVSVSVVAAAEFNGSGLTRAALRGARYRGVHALGDLGARIAAELAAGGFCYGYHSELDLLGHLYGPGSPEWRLQLRQVDRLVESIVDALPRGGLLAVVADHGMVAVDPGTVVDLDERPDLLDGVQDVGGESRARYLYVADGALDTVLATWRAALADTAWIVSRDEAIEAGWFGDRVTDTARARIGDIVVAAQGNTAVVRRTTEPIEASLRGHHGSLTTAEQRVPLLLAHR